MNALNLPAVQIERLQRAIRSLSDPPLRWSEVGLADIERVDQAHLPAAVLVPIIWHPEGLSVLFTRRTEHMRTHAGQISFPGGRIEPVDADVVAAALRETYEETGIEPCHVQPLGYLDSFVTVSGYCVAPVVGWVGADYKVIPDPTEVAEIFEVPLDYILAPKHLRRQSVQWQGQPREIFEWDWQGRRIWGATAAILLNLIQRLEAA